MWACCRRKKRQTAVHAEVASTSGLKLLKLFLNTSAKYTLFFLMREGEKNQFEFSDQYICCLILIPRVACPSLSPCHSVPVWSLLFCILITQSTHTEQLVSIH